MPTQEKFNTPFYAASRQMIDMIIRPHETREKMISALEALLNHI